ncbi:hypothetical protein GCM10027284_43440 [Cyclobacterium sediminis]
MWKIGNYVCTYDKCGRRPEDTGHTASGVKLAEPVPTVGKRSTGHFISRNKWRQPIHEIARRLNPVARGLLNYYHKLRGESMREVWNQLNHRLLKWVKWEKGLYKMAAVRWLKRQYKSSPGLFAHWKLVQP